MPDGLLNLVNLSSLPDGDGYLAERPAIIHYLTTERDLLVTDRDAGAPGGLLTVGGAAFDERHLDSGDDRGAARRGLPVPGSDSFREPAGIAQRSR